MKDSLPREPLRPLTVFAVGADVVLRIALDVRPFFCSALLRPCFSGRGPGGPSKSGPKTKRPEVAARWTSLSLVSGPRVRTRRKASARNRRSFVVGLPPSGRSRSPTRPLRTGDRRAGRRLGSGLVVRLRGGRHSPTASKVPRSLARPRGPGRRRSRSARTAPRSGSGLRAPSRKSRSFRRRVARFCGPPGRQPT